MYRRHSFEERLNIVSRLIEGESIRSLCRELRLDHHDVSLWLLRYQKYGDEGLRDIAPRNYSVAEKLKIIEEYTVKGLSLQEICLRYDLSRTTVKIWKRKLREGKSLHNKRQERTTKEPMARPKKKEPQTELEKLQAENLRLRAENALLKKVKALVEEEEARARLNGYKSSTN